MSVAGGGLCSGGLCPGRVSVQGGSLSREGLCPGRVSVQGGSLSREGLCPGRVSVRWGLCSGGLPLEGEGVYVQRGDPPSTDWHLWKHFLPLRSVKNATIIFSWLTRWDRTSVYWRHTSTSWKTSARTLCRNWVASPTNTTSSCLKIGQSHCYHFCYYSNQFIYFPVLS